MSWAETAVAVYAAMFRERIHFAQAAYRDGEWYCMLGQSGGNCNGEKYDRRLGEMLRRTLLDPVGQWCVFWFPHPTKGIQARTKAVAWLDKHEPAVTWIPDRPVGMANEQGIARPIFQAFRTRRVLLVGPEHLASLDLFDFRHIIVPDGTAWRHVDRICHDIRDVVESDDLVLFASGMATNVMVHRLWPELRGVATLYDIGATLDPYVGVYSRGTYRSREWQKEVRPRNLP